MRLSAPPTLAEIAACPELVERLPGPVAGVLALEATGLVQRLTVRAASAGATSSGRAKSGRVNISGLGSYFRRGPAYWIEYSIAGVPHRESVAKILGKPPALTTSDDAVRALKLRRAPAPLDPPADPPMPLHLHERLGPPAVILPAALRSVPIVYAVVEPNGVLQYIGMSRRGLERPLAAQHRVLRGGVSEDASLFVWMFPTADAAAAVEHNLLVALAPRSNGTRPRVSATPMGSVGEARAAVPSPFHLPEGTSEA
jgi:hypothetical protein